MKNTIKLSVLMLFMCVCFSVNAQSSEYQDVIYLHNGSVIKGFIIEQVPNESVKIETTEGNIFVYSMTDVQKMTKEKKVVTAVNSSNTQYSNGAKIDPNLSPKSPVVSGLCSFLIPGLGQFLNGNVGAGCGFLGANIALYTGAIICMNDGGDEAAIAGTVLLLANLGNCIWSICDAVSGAKKYNIEHGYQVFNVGKNSNIYVNPDVQFQNDYAMGGAKLEPSFGAKMTLCF
ncbi:MAG: hypothetical protein R3Y22_07275 [Bacteroidales bacterium]